MQETLLINGSTSIKGNIAYVPMNPFVQEGSVRDNITFGRPYDRDHVLKVINLVKLHEHEEFINAENDQILDFDASYLDQFSKLKLCLARAIYSQSDIILMDDPFAEFHDEESLELFKAVVSELKQKIVVVVTNNIQII